MNQSPVVVTWRVTCNFVKDQFQYYKVSADNGAATGSATLERANIFSRTPKQVALFWDLRKFERDEQMPDKTASLVTSTITVKTHTEVTAMPLLCGLVSATAMPVFAPRCSSVELPIACNVRRIHQFEELEIDDRAHLRVNVDRAEAITVDVAKKPKVKVIKVKTVKAVKVKKVKFNLLSKIKKM